MIISCGIIAQYNRFTNQLLVVGVLMVLAKDTMQCDGHAVILPEAPRGLPHISQMHLQGISSEL